MSFMDYVHNTVQKYKLAVAIGVIKSKPEDQSIETYLKELRDKLNNDNIDNLDDTICSEDFSIDLTCIDHCDVKNSKDKEINQSIVVCNDLEVNEASNYVNMEIIDENTRDSECFIFENIDTIDSNLNRLGTLQIAIPDKTTNEDETTELNLVQLKNLKTKNNIDQNFSLQTNYNEHDENSIQRKSNSKRGEETNNPVNVKKDDNNKNLKAQDTERNQTKDNSVRRHSGGRIKPNVNNKVACSQVNNDETQIWDERSNSSLNLLDDYYQIAKPVEANDVEALLSIKNIGRGGVISKNLHEFDETDTQATYFVSQLEAIIGNPPPNVTVATHAINSTSIRTEINIPPNEFCDSQLTELYTVPEFTQNCTHYSQSQGDVVIPDYYLFNQNKNQITNNNNDVNISKDLADDSQNIKVDFNADPDVNENNTVKLTNNNLYDDAQNICFNKNDLNNVMSIENALPNEPPNKHFKFNINSNVNAYGTPDLNNVMSIENALPNEPPNKHFQFNINSNVNASGTPDLNRRVKILNIERRILPENENSHIVLEDKGKNSDEDLMDIDGNDDDSMDVERRQREKKSQTVPFKVIEELNNVNKYLNRKNEIKYSSQCVSVDSAYKSDSQNSQRSRTDSTLQITCMNQSGHSLLRFLATCHFSANTGEIVETVSQVFGQLIDRLHDEEHCPTFLQDLLEIVDGLLNDVFTDTDLSDDMLTKKEEQINRLTLLNRSQHVIKYSLEKIIAILIEVHGKITDSDKTYELRNVVEVENLCYLFNLLEFLLKEYKGLKIAETVPDTAVSENRSQEILKRSSISEIWRKKWKISKEKESTGKREVGVCVLKKCGEILNKIVVETIEQYSLISYVALQCFNILQS